MSIGIYARIIHVYVKLGFQSKTYRLYGTFLRSRYSTQGDQEHQKKCYCICHVQTASQWTHKMLITVHEEILAHTNLKCELPRDKTNKMTCAPSEDSDQPGHAPSLIRAFAVRLM